MRLPVNKLTIINGQHLLRDDGEWKTISPEEYQKQEYLQRMTQETGSMGRTMIGAGKAVSDAMSGFRQLTYGDEAEENAFREQNRQAYQGMEDYGGISPAFGEFAASASTAVLPGGLPAQIGIGTGQGMIENPNAPLYGGLLGGSLTWAGDWVGDVLGRMGSRLSTKRMQLDEASRLKIERAEEQGLKFRPGQKSPDIQRQLMEEELSSNPAFAGIDAPRWLNNQSRLNDLAAGYLEVQPQGRMTGEMLGQAYDNAKEGFKALDEYDGLIGIDDGRMIEIWEDMTDPAQTFMKQFARKYKSVLDGEVSGKEFMQARNWLADQSRKSANQKLGIGDEIQSVIGVMDEAAENSVDQVTRGKLARARNQWKAMLVVEASQKSAAAKASGDVSPVSAYNALEKYYGRKFRHGKVRDPFMDAVQGMSAAKDMTPRRRPSGQGASVMNPLQLINEKLYQEPLARKYMEGSSVAEILLGASLMDDALPGAGKLGIGTGRGLMSEEE